MKSIQVDKDILDQLRVRAASPGESAADILRRELRVPNVQVVIDVDDDTYAFIASKSLAIGETASAILRRELNLAGGPSPTAPDAPGGADPHWPPNTGFETITFRIAPNTGANAWNSRDTMLVARKGDTLRIVNEDAVAHQLHTSGSPFAHAAMAIMPGHSEDFLLSSTFDPVQQSVLYDHLHGPQAQFWLRVVDNS